MKNSIKEYYICDNTIIVTAAVSYDSDTYISVFVKLSSKKDIEKIGNKTLLIKEEFSKAMKNFYSELNIMNKLGFNQMIETGLVDNEEEIKCLGVGRKDKLEKLMLNSHCSYLL